MKDTLHSTHVHTYVRTSECFFQRKLSELIGEGEEYDMEAWGRYLDIALIQLFLLEGSANGGG